MGSSSIRMENTYKTVYLRVYEFWIYVTNYVIKIAFIKCLHDTHKIKTQNSFSLLFVLGSFALDFLFVNFCFLNVIAKRLNDLL